MSKRRSKTAQRPPRPEGVLERLLALNPERPDFADRMAALEAELTQARAARQARKLAACPSTVEALDPTTWRAA
ncbi:MAG: hypothetical protein KQJ78_24015 [Deltaproteobacteria bacterium]|nr:hypothetical protein [Deltaproteobacteria bacterium]